MSVITLTLQAIFCLVSNTLLSCIALLNGCTTLSQDECKVSNWQSLGYKHGVNGGDYADGITKTAT
ncbi:hypothetical protein [Pseudoalteromonas sp. ASV78]|uniref:hypothetical protein n=1 Tax=Pseudoalteromonas sp. ASV78 TaxID=3397851 RepID=UPI0039FCFE14